MNYIKLCIGISLAIYLPDNAPLLPLLLLQHVSQPSSISLSVCLLFAAPSNNLPTPCPTITLPSFYPLLARSKTHPYTQAPILHKKKKHMEKSRESVSTKHYYFSCEPDSSHDTTRHTYTHTAPNSYNESDRVIPNSPKRKKRKQERTKETEGERTGLKNIKKRPPHGPFNPPLHPLPIR